MRYSVHIGQRSEEWPAKVAEHGTRAEARRTAVAELSKAPTDPPHKAQVRLASAQLLDVYGRRNGIRVFLSYSARQRGAATADSAGVLQITTEEDAT